MKESDDQGRTSETAPTRRQFLAGAAPAVAAAATIGSRDLFAQSATGAAAAAIPSLKIPKEFTSSLNDKPVEGKFEGNGMMGADIFAQLCKKEGLAAMFCCPGNYTVVHAISAAGVPTYGGRTEGTMAAAADGFSRATGEVVACSGTEGPGFTNMITSVAAAYYARTPLLVLASNVQLAGEDREAGIQAMYQQPITTGIKKYGKRMILPNRVHEYGAYAFRQLKSGVPGPVHLDFPGEVARERFKDPASLTDYCDSTKYRSESRAVPAAKDVAKAVELIGRAERPLLVAGHGVFHHQGWEALLAAVEKNDIAVVTSGPMRGHFPDDHRLSASLGPKALMSADLLIFVGQYSMPSPSDYRVNPDVRVIRVHPEGEDLGRNWPLELGVVGDEKAFLEMLTNSLPRRKRDSWVAEVCRAQGVRRHPRHLLQERIEVQRGQRRALPVGDRQGDQRLLLQGEDRSPADAERLGRLLVAAHHRAVSACESPRAGDRLPVSVRCHRPGHGDDDRGRDGREGRHRPAARL